MYDKICSLLTMRQTVSDTGDPIETVEAEHEVFCRKYSADYKEKSMAATRGKTAEIVVELADRIDYAGELFVRVDGQIFEVVDTKYTDTSDGIKLVVGRWDYR